MAKFVIDRKIFWNTRISPSICDKSFLKCIGKHEKQVWVQKTNKQTNLCLKKIWRGLTPRIPIFERLPYPREVPLVIIFAKMSGKDEKPMSRKSF